MTQGQLRDYIGVEKFEDKHNKQQQKLEQYEKFLKSGVAVHRRISARNSS